MELQGERVTLRPWCAEDIPNLVRHADNPNVARNLRDQFPQPYTQQDAESWIAICQELPEGHLAFAIEFEGEAVGGIGGDFKKDVHYRTFEVGYWLGEDFWRKGIAGEALDLLCDYLFTKTNCVRIEAHVYEPNSTSAGLLLKHGFELEGRQRCAVEKNGKLFDLLIHARIRPGVAKSAGPDPCDILSL